MAKLNEPQRQDHRGFGVEVGHGATRAIVEEAVENEVVAEVVELGEAMEVVLVEVMEAIRVEVLEVA